MEEQLCEGLVVEDRGIIDRQKLIHEDDALELFRPGHLGGGLVKRRNHGFSERWRGGEKKERGSQPKNGEGGGGCGNGEDGGLAVLPQRAGSLGDALAEPLGGPCWRGMAQ